MFANFIVSHESHFQLQFLSRTPAINFHYTVTGIPSTGFHPFQSLVLVLISVNGPTTKIYWVYCACISAMSSVRQ